MTCPDKEESSGTFQNVCEETLISTQPSAAALALPPPAADPEEDIHQILPSSRTDQLARMVT